jgi:hypothetical protein
MGFQYSVPLGRPDAKNWAAPGFSGPVLFPSTFAIDTHSFTKYSAPRNFQRLHSRATYVVSVDRERVLMTKFLSAHEEKTRLSS